MGLMMSVLVFSIGVLEALACFEHVRQSYLPLDLGRKRRRLVLDVGTGTIRHRETRRSSEFQRDPHVFLRSIQAAVEEEGDEKESEELEAIFQAVEAHNIHSTHIMHRQDPVFLTVNDIDESDSCASSEVSRTSTPNTVIMNMSPGFDRGSIAEPCYIPPDSEHLGLKNDEVFSNRKDMSITQLDIGQFMCIRDGESPFESVDSHGPNIGEVLQPFCAQNESKDTTVSAINPKLSPDKQIEINEGIAIFSMVDAQSTDVISSIPIIENDEEKSREKHVTIANSLSKTEANEITVTVPGKELTSNNVEINTNLDLVSLKNGKNSVADNVKHKNIVNIESFTTTTISVDNNKPRFISEGNHENITQDISLEANHITNENSPTQTKSSILESNNRKTIEKYEILVKSQAPSVKEPLIENKGKDETCETQLEQIIESGKQSRKEGIQSLEVITNSVDINNHENHFIPGKGESFDSAEEIHYIDQSHSLGDLSDSKNFPIPPTLANEVLLHENQLKESEIIPLKLHESKNEVIETVIADRLNNDPLCPPMPEQTETVSESERKSTERSSGDTEVCKLLVDNKPQFDVGDQILTADNEFHKTTDLEIVNQSKELDQETIARCLIEAQICDSMDSLNVCIDNNSNIVNETSADQGERKTLPDNDQTIQKIMSPDTDETVGIQTCLLSTESLIVDSDCLKEQVVPAQQELDPGNIALVDTETSKHEDVHDMVEKNFATESEHKTINLKEGSVNSNHELAFPKLEEILDEARHSANVSEDTLNFKKGFAPEKVKLAEDDVTIVEGCERLVTDVDSGEQTISNKDFNNCINTHRPDDSVKSTVTIEEFESSAKGKAIVNQTTPNSVDLNQDHPVDSLEEVRSEIIVSKTTRLERMVNNENTSQGELISDQYATENGIGKIDEQQPLVPQKPKAKIKTDSNEEITSKDLLDVKESLKPLPQKKPVKDNGGRPSDQKALKKDKGILAKQETQNVSPLADDVTVLVGDLPPQNEFTPVEDITSPDKAFWVRGLKGLSRTSNIASEPIRTRTAK